ncbi:hypothetical protein JHW45_01285 [Paracoccus stylophorae]|uniref:Uncharacterized protein n=1 Tax=Paracoccus stylophorae TaxID=659350 RepID=A0ABY7SVL5_9RHOB|nr:hypothetical protein [Paracoccus stylophorae]WCR11075.1 hypothetical protein JHW45_01285 [Paracoccus stylophorae]
MAIHIAAGRAKAARQVGNDQNLDLPGWIFEQPIPTRHGDDLVETVRICVSARLTGSLGRALRCAGDFARGLLH